MLESQPRALRHFRGRLDAEGLDVDDPHRHLGVGGELAPQLELAHLAVGVLEHELLHARVEEGGEERPVASRGGEGVVVRVAEADVERDLGADALQGGIEGRDHGARLTLEDAMLARGHDVVGLVDLDEVATRGHQGLDLGVDHRDQVRDQAVLGSVGTAPSQGDEEGHGARHGHAHGPVGVGAGEAELLHDAETLRRADAIDDLVGAVRVVVGRAEAARHRERPDALQAVVEAADEGDPSHLAVGDHVDPGLHLIADGQAHGVLVRLLEIDGSEAIGLRGLADEMDPGGQPVAAAHRGGDERHGPRHGSLPSSGWRLPEGDVVLLPLVGRHRLHGDLAVDGGLQPLEPLALVGFQVTRELGMGADHRLAPRRLAGPRLDFAEDLSGQGGI